MTNLANSWYDKYQKSRDQNAELLELLAEALEHLREYDDYSPTSHLQLERKIDDVVNPRKA